MTPRIHTADNQHALVPMVIRERLRRELYAGCDRAPEWERKHENLFAASDAHGPASAQHARQSGPRRADRGGSI